MADVSYPRTNVWEPGIPKEGQEVDDLRRQIVELRDTIRQIQDQLEYGPIHGANYPVYLKFGNVTHYLPTGGQGRQPLFGSAQLVALWAVANEGDLTIDVNHDGTSLLAAGAINVTSARTQLKDPDDFTKQEFGEPETGTYFSIDIDAITTNARILSVVLILKNMPRANYL